MSDRDSRQSATLAELLSATRSAYGLSLAEAATQAKASQRLATALEGGDYEVIPDDIYTRIGLKSYALTLNLDESAVLALYAQEREASRQALAAREHRPWTRHPSDAIPAVHLAVVPRLLKTSLVALAGLTVAAFFLFEVKSLLAPPAVALLTPTDGMVTLERDIVVEGRTEPEAAVDVNGKSITPDSRGIFHDNLSLQEGLNVIRVVAKKKHSRDNTVTLRVIVEPKQQPTALNTGIEGLRD